jgi:SnoaL-like domain
VTATAWSELRELVDAYAVGIDTKDLGAVAALFTVDGEYVGPGFHLVGRDQIGGAGRLVSGFAATVHVVGALRVDVDGHRAQGESTCAAHHLLPDGGGETHFLTYRDEFRYEGAGWLIARRAIVSLWREPA